MNTARTMKAGSSRSVGATVSRASSEILGRVHMRGGAETVRRRLQIGSELAGVFEDAGRLSGGGVERFLRRLVAEDRCCSFRIDCVGDLDPLSRLRHRESMHLPLPERLRTSSCRRRLQRPDVVVPDALRVGSGPAADSSFWLSSFVSHQTERGGCFLVGAGFGHREAVMPDQPVRLPRAGRLNLDADIAGDLRRLRIVEEGCQPGHRD